MFMLMIKKNKVAQYDNNYDNDIIIIIIITLFSTLTASLIFLSDYTLFYPVLITNNAELLRIKAHPRIEQENDSDLIWLDGLTKLFKNISVQFYI